jgi:hypothetical protein
VGRRTSRRSSTGRSAAGGAPYAFAGGADERDRLRALERWFDPPTWAALEAVGLAPGARCWEVGAGAGSIARRLAAAVGPAGEVIATDGSALIVTEALPEVVTAPA